MEDLKNDVKNVEAWRCKIQMYVIKGFIRPCNLWWIEEKLEMQRTFVEAFLFLAQEGEKEYEKVCKDLELWLFGFKNINFVKGIIMLQKNFSQNLRRGFEVVKVAMSCHCPHILLKATM
jgi:hypothetical protein